MAYVRLPSCALIGAGIRSLEPARPFVLALLPPQAVGNAGARVELELRSQRSADGQVIGGLADVVDTEHVGAGVGAVTDRREGAGETPPGRPAGDRAKEVLARDGEQNWALE